MQTERLKVRIRCCSLDISPERVVICVLFCVDVRRMVKINSKMHLFHNENVDNNLFGRAFKFQLWIHYSFVFEN